MRSLPGTFCLFAILLTAAPGAQPGTWFADLTGENSGHTVCNFLNLPRSAAELGSGVSDPGGMDATDLPDLTANTALVDRYRFAFTHLEWFMGMRSEFCGALFPVLDVGTFGGYARLFTPGKIENARDIEEQPSDPHYLEYSIGATFARGFLNNRLSAGCAVAFVESRIEELTGRTISGSVDLRYAPFPFVSTHLYATSFGKPVSYGSDLSEPLPLRAGWSLQVRPLPADHPLKKIFDFGIGLGVNKIADEPLVAGISTGIEAGACFSLRAGYEYVNSRAPGISGLSLGAGYHRGPLTIDGGWRPLSEEFGKVWAATILYERDELKPLTAEDHYNIALKHYNKRRYAFCTASAKRALRLDPNMWKAHALLSRIRSDILRSKRREIAIVYTGNAQGHFVAPPEQGALGGFGRQAAVIATLRSQFPLTIAIEAGNLIVDDMQSPRVSFAGFYLNHIGYDAVGCGKNEFLYGAAKFIKTMEGKQPIICSNALSTPSGLVRNRIVERDGYRFFVASYIGSGTIPGKERSLLLPLDANALAADAKSCDIRILIVHDTWEGVRLLSAGLSGFDIVICGSLDQRFASPMAVGSTRILSAGNNGQYVGNLIVRFDENRKISGMENRLIPLQPDIVPDSVIAKKIAQFTKSAAEAPVADGVSRPVDGTFAFTSDRTGRDEVYLKMTDQFAEFPLTRSIADTCRNPAWSFAASYITCSAARDSCGRLLIMRLDGSDKRYVSDSLYVRDASFSPNGEWLYLAAAPCGDTITDLLRVRPSGGPVFPVVAWTNALETAPVFSSDGAMMIFGSNRDGSMQLYLTNPEAELPVRITDEKANHTSPAFSPDGAFIAYLSDAANFGGRRDLWIFERSGGTHRRITQRSDVKEYCWLSDSKTIVYTMGAVNDELAKVDVATYRFAKLVPADTARTWDERSPQTAKIDGKEWVVYVRYFPDGDDSQIFRVRPDGTENTRIVGSEGRDWLGERPVQR